MAWKGTWQSGVEYKLHECVRDRGWTMICIADSSTQVPAPEAISTSAWVLDDAPTWTVNTYEGRVTSGLRLRVPTTGLYTVDKYRVWIEDTSADIFVRTVLLNNRTGAVTASALLSADNFQLGWNEVAAESALLEPGGDYSVLVDAQRIADTVDYSFPYTYNVVTDEIPVNGNGNMTRDGGRDFWFHYRDENGDDRKATLMACVPGTEITLSEQGNPANFRRFVPDSYPVDQTVTDHVYMFSSSVANGGSGLNDQVGNVIDVTIKIPGSSSGLTPYVSDADRYVAYPELTGELGFDQGLTSPVLVESEDAFGIDIRFTEWSISDEWDVVSAPGPSGI